jgi:hypothetical protein
VHFDGARIWESTPHLGHSLSEVAGLDAELPRIPEYVRHARTVGRRFLGRLSHAAGS